MGSDHGKTLGQCLRDSLPVKRIGVIERQIEQAVCMLHRVRQYSEVQVSDAPRHGSLSKVSWPSDCLVAISNERYYTLVPASACTDIAFREMRSGPQERDRIEGHPHLAALDESLDLFVGHRLPPIRIVNQYLVLQRAELRLLAFCLCGANHIHHGLATAANRHGFAVFDRP